MYLQIQRIEKEYQVFSYQEISNIFQYMHTQFNHS